jgi:hypothetical protein
MSDIVFVPLLFLILIGIPYAGFSFAKFLFHKDKRNGKVPNPRVAGRIAGVFAFAAFSMVMFWLYLYIKASRPAGDTELTAAEYYEILIGIPMGIITASFTRRILTELNK